VKRNERPNNLIAGRPQMEDGNYAMPIIEVRWIKLAPRRDKRGKGQNERKIKHG
jgi:hypothetical protein